MRDLAWLVLALIAALGAAGVAVFGTLGLSRVDTTLATTLRAIIMAVMLSAVALASGKLRLLWLHDPPITSRVWLYIVLAGASGAVSWLAYFGALKVGPAGPVAAIDRLSVALVFLFGVLILGDRYSWRGWLGLVLIIAGVMLVATERPTRAAAPPAPPSAIAPDDH